MKKSLSLACLIALSSLSASAVAGQAFVRGELGRSDLRLKVEGLGSVSDKDAAASLRGGYWFNSNFALEGHYSKFYDESIFDGSARYDAELSAVGLGVVYKEHAFSGELGYFVQLRGGLARGKLAVGSGVGSESSTKPYYGIGAGYDFNKNFGLSLNYDHNQGSKGDVKITAETLSLGLEARF